MVIYNVECKVAFNRSRCFLLNLSSLVDPFVTLAEVKVFFIHQKRLNEIGLLIGMGIAACISTILCITLIYSKTLTREYQPKSDIWRELATPPHVSEISKLISIR